MRTCLLLTILLPLFAACTQTDDDDFGPQVSCPEQTCGDNSGCLDGFVCTHGACALPVSCGQLADQGCPQDGYPYGWNDCLWTGCNCYVNDQQQQPPPPPPQPESCSATATCTQSPPACPAGQIPELLSGCYDGACREIAYCDAPPPCTELSHEADCTARSDCKPTYEGFDCKDPSGAPCTSGDTQCTCATYDFSGCVAQ